MSSFVHGALPPRRLRETLRQVGITDVSHSVESAPIATIDAMAPVPDAVREFLAEGLWAHVVTMKRNGQPHVNLCWAGMDGDELVFASFFDAKRAARVRRDPQVTLSFHAKTYDGPALYPYLVIDGRATVTDGGALEVMDHLAQWYIGPGATYPNRAMPPGWAYRVAIDKIYGQGPWNERWVAMDRPGSDPAR
jgi:PPOX class probable F420-dependent enzyme